MKIKAFDGTAVAAHNVTEIQEMLSGKCRLLSPSPHDFPHMTISFLEPGEREVTHTFLYRPIGLRLDFISDKLLSVSAVVIIIVDIIIVIVIYCFCHFFY